MTNKGILSKNYYIVPEAVADLGADVYNMMAEADQAMREASEIIADIASLTERVPSHIRCSELLEACASTQAEIKSVDFLSYGQKVDQGLQNLLDHNQYITEQFVKKMGMHTEKMRGMGEEFKRLTDTITYSGKGVQSKGIAFSAVSNTEVENTDGEEEASVHGTEDMLCGGAAEVLEVSTEEVMAQVENINRNNNRYINQYNNNLQSGEDTLRNYMNARGIADKDEIDKFIIWLAGRRPDLLVELYVVDSKSSGDVWNVYDEIFNEVTKDFNSGYNDIYYQYMMITVDDVESLDMGEDLDQTQKETFVACWNKLVSMGVPKIQIIAVMANIYAESRYSATNAQESYGYIGIYDNNYDYKVGDGVGYGILQWTLKDRKEALLEYAENTGCKVSDLETQLGYFQYEMEEGICVYYWSKFLTKKSLYDATFYFLDIIENPEENNIEERMGYAIFIEKWYSGIK